MQIEYRYLLKGVEKMAADSFNFTPAVVPRVVRGMKKSKYAATVEAVHQHMKDHKGTQAVKVELGEVTVKSAVASFRAAIARLYPDTLKLVQRGGELYIERKK
ncbi:MAG: hypothetical protein JW990_14320 [Thermoleophilia bacterium]|nr:hypothetical protein [Thermoleophilia bacterium]